MKQLYSILLISIIFVGCNNNTKQLPNISMDIPEEIYLDTIQNNITVHTSFNITNTGQQALIIKDIQASCDCTIIDQWDSIIEAGHSSIVNIEILPSHTGTLDKNIVVRSNIKNEFSAISIKGFVVD